MKLLSTVALTLALAYSAPLVAQDSAASNAQILRDKIKADKKLLIAENMGLTESEAKVFWPIYDSYQKDLGQINERLGKAITAYADAYNKGSGSIPDATAKQLMDEALTVEESEVKLKRTYQAKLLPVLPASKVARYLQLETKIRSLTKVELADKIPLVH